MTEQSQMEFVDRVVEKWKGGRGNLIMILHEIQDRLGYVPRDLAMRLSELLEIPLARIYEVLTFYHYFKVEPPGRHQIAVCMGTACYLKGTPQIIEEIKSLLNIEEGGRTRDNLFQLDLVRCLGCCGLAPALMIDGKVFGKVRKEQVAEILASYQDRPERGGGDG